MLLSLKHFQSISEKELVDARNGAEVIISLQVETREEALCRLTLGLIRRCRRRVVLGLSDLGEQGYEQKGPLLQAIQRVLRRYGRAS